jgi:hypothetical protein
MKKSFFIQPSLDATGFWASAICTLHCVAVPILLSFTAFSSLAFLERASVEYSILSVSSIVGIGSLLPSYFRHHRKLQAIYLLVIGFLLIAASRFVLHEGYEAWLTATGAAMVAIAHYVNYRLCKNAHQHP